MNYKNSFPLLKNGITYLDSAATTQKPVSVINSLTNYYQNYNSNPNRSFYDLAENATRLYDQSRKSVANFINALPEEIIFTKSATESLNMIAMMIKQIVSKGKNEIVLSVSEHNSNLLPWINFSKKYGFKINFIYLNKDFSLDYGSLNKIINKKTAIVSICSISNVLGLKNELKLVSKLTKKFGAYFIVDASQSIAHIKTDVKDLDCDFLAFSSHKAYGPMGLGVLYGKKHLLETLKPVYLGGGMINSIKPIVLKEIPLRFEAGTPNLEGAIGLMESINFLSKIGLDKIQKHERELFTYAYNKLLKIKDIQIYTNKSALNIISFNLKGIHSHDVASILGEEGICVRAGNHCNHNLMNFLGIDSCVRISFGIYNNKKDVDKLILVLNKIIKKFSK